MQTQNGKLNVFSKGFDLQCMYDAQLHFQFSNMFAKA